MAKAQPLTPEQHDIIAELRGEKGWTIQRIADHLGVTRNAVAYRCLIDGIEKAGPVPAPLEWRGPMVCQRGAYQVRRFTAEEDQRLVEYESRGHSHTEIGRRLGRRANSIKGRLATLARREERALAQTEQKS